MKVKKIVNDPVHGFISIPEGIVFDLLQHPYVQRLRRISQLGLTYYVYPGATHNRLSHALGAMHLMQKALNILRNKGININDEEYTAALIAILLHDIGHGPFSHALENTILPYHHEALSLLFMEELNKNFNGQLTLAISIFKGKYAKKFLTQLVSSQLDVDRLDYLSRDSFFTGVHEGVISYDRIISMFNVHENELVVEEKGIHSVEKFLVARTLMYWQAYLHKTAVISELMLINALTRIKDLYANGLDFTINDRIKYFLDFKDSNEIDPVSMIEAFSKIDDIDIIGLLKDAQNTEDKVLSLLSNNLINRTIFKPFYSNDENKKQKYCDLINEEITNYNLTEKEKFYLILSKEETLKSYNKNNEINILYKDKTIHKLSNVSSIINGLSDDTITFYGHPRSFV